MAVPLSLPINVVHPRSASNVETTPRMETGLPGNRAKLQKVAKTWEVLQRRMARHSGAVAAHNVEDRPLLLAAAQDLPPSAWDQKLERWPEVAKTKERMRPRGNDVPQSARPVYTPLFSRSSPEDDFLSSPTPSAMELGDASGLITLKTPPYARSPVPQDLSQSEFFDHELSSSPPSLFLLGESSILTDDHELSIESSIEAMKERRDRRRNKGVSSLWGCEDVVDKLQYLRDCKDAMGWQRYGVERRRLEFQSDLKKTQKYSPRLPGGRQIDPQASLAMTSTLIAHSPNHTSKSDRRKSFDFDLQPEGDDASLDSSPTGSPRRQSSASPTNARRISATSPTNARRTSATISSPMAGRRNSGTVDFLPADMPLAEKQKTQAIAAFEYDHLCRQRKVATPTLRTFAVEVRTEPAPLSVDNWSLGDAPLVALAASPLRNSLAGVNECRLSGNRLTNAGLRAVVESLGARNTTILDLSENAFNFRGVGKLTEFISRGIPRLREIDISRNRLDEHTVAALINEIADSCPALEQARFSDVQMGRGVESGKALRELTRDSLSLLFLDVSFNMLQGDGALALIDGLYENGSNRCTLRSVNLSWNCMGQGTLHSKVSERLAETLRDNDVLFHVDISFNGFSVPDCMSLANGVAKNNTLWGLHVDGNAATLDADGFIRILEDMRQEMMEGPKTSVKPDLASMKQAKSKKKKGKKGGRRASVLGGLPSGHVSAETRVRSLLPKHLLAREFEIWHRDQDNKVTAKMPRNALEWSPGMDLPESLVENPGLTPNECKNTFTRLLPPRMMNEWLEKLSQNIRLELQIPYFKHWSPLLGRPNRGTQHCIGASCWVCQGWVEVNFTLTPGVSFPEELATSKNAYAFTSLDNFARPVLLQRKGNSAFEGARFMPPTQEPILVVFQIADRLLVAADRPRKVLKHSLRVVLCDGSKGIECYSASSEDGARIAEIQEANLLLVESIAEERLKRVAAVSSEGQQSWKAPPSDLLNSKTRPRAYLPVSVAQDRKNAQVSLWSFGSFK